MEESSSQPKTIRAVLIAIVIIRKGNKFMVTSERDGWYLPAGRVDLGETFTTGGRREAFEEAGIPVKLDGIYRFEHSPSINSSRIRCIFAASPVDDTPPRGPEKADNEIIEARWMTLKEARKIPSNQWRSTEVLQMFKWVEDGAKIYQLNLLQGLDGPTISHSKVMVNIVYNSTVIFMKEKKFLAMKDSKNNWRIPSSLMTIASTFETAAANVLYDSLQCRVVLQGLIRIEHVAPPTLDGVGFITCYYLGELPFPIPNSFKETLRWFDMDEFSTQEGVPNHHLKILQEIDSAKPELFPVDFIVRESSPY